MIIIIVLIIVAIIYFVLKPYFIHYDTIIAFTGGLGSGKSLISTEYAIKLLRKNRSRVKWYNLTHFKKKREKPMLYSSIPLRISRNEWSIELTPDHLLLQERLALRSVCFIDEIDSFASQFDFGQQNIKVVFNEFCRLYRHYTQGGYIVCNTQASDNLVLQIRRRLNSVLNLMHFNKFFKLYWVKIRNISVSEEIKMVTEENAESPYHLKIGLIPFIRRYDTYCYSRRYDTVPQGVDTRYSELKKDTLLTCPKKHAIPKVKNPKNSA